MKSNALTILVEEYGRDPLKDLDVWRIILKSILKKRNGKEWIGFTWFRVANNGSFVNKMVYLQVL